MAKSIAEQMLDRILSVACYITFGMAGLGWLIICAVLKKQISTFGLYNIYQSIFLSIVLYIISWLCQIAVGLLSAVPILDKLTFNFVLYFTQTPIYFNRSLSGLIITAIVIYLCVFAFFGKFPYLPVISDVINKNLRR